MFVLPGWFVNDYMVSIDTITKFISVLAMISIVSMDQNVPYNDIEKFIYSNSLYQLLVIFSVAYQNLNNIKFAIVVTLAWALLKHYKKIKKKINNIEKSN